MVAHEDPAWTGSPARPGPPAIHTVRTGCSQVRRAPWEPGTRSEEDDVLHDVVTMTTALGGVGVLLVMVASGMLPVTAPQPARVRVRATERPDGR
jgi:hypothetical protein